MMYKYNAYINKKSYNKTAESIQNKSQKLVLFDSDIFNVQTEPNQSACSFYVWFGWIFN